MILINGSFLGRRLNGIERYAYEITRRLDEICKQNEIAIIVPKNINIPEYRNLKVIRYGKKIQNVIWQMCILQWFLVTRRKYTILEFGNTALPFSPGIVFLHDIYCENFAEDFSHLMDKIVRCYNRFQYRLITNISKQIFTVSEFSKNEISKTFKIPPSRINIIYSSADHIQYITPDMSVFNDFPILNDKPFFFSLGSLSKRKNINWIIEYAKKKPESFFAISGTSLPTVKINNLDNLAINNIIFLGYLDDRKVKALMIKCKAFILPSYYEGFGLTPLEALSCGAKSIVAKAASLPEIYKNTVHYIDPFNTDIDLEELLKEPVENPDEILLKYSYDKSAAKLYNFINTNK